MLRDRPMAATSSKKLFARAQRKIPGGVNSPVRAWKAIGDTPRFIARGKGAYLFDADGNKYIDYVGSWGPLIFGHARREIVSAICLAARRGMTFGAPTRMELELAEQVTAVIPSIQKLRLVSSGTEATMSALRLARAFAKRTKIVKFDGCYHGHSDGLLVKSGSGVATLGLPDSPGVPESFAKETLVAKFNDIDSVQRLFELHGSDIAAVIVEPICGNMGVIPPRADFLANLRRITRDHKALLIFDEVITGFRVALGGAQKLYNVAPDLTCFGKIIGGGLPLAAFGGRREVMDLLAPQGPVYQAGTLSGNPVAVSAGLKTLQLLARRGTYQQLEAMARRLEHGLSKVITAHHLRATINRVGSMLTIFFGVESVTNPDQARACDRAQFTRYFHGMLRQGIYLPPAQFEAAFVSLAHSKADIDRTITAFNTWAKRDSQG